MAQPIIRGIQAVGAVDIKYEYNSSDHVLSIPTNSIRINDQTTGSKSINTDGGVSVAGFRLDSEFLRAVQQIASSAQIPILGGGAVALTNNNRSGTLSINCTRVSTPSPEGTYDKEVKDDTTGQVIHKAGDLTGEGTGTMLKGNGVGPIGNDPVYDLVFLAQVQQAQPGGDSMGATITVDFMFCGLHTTIQFQGCTVASVDPLGLSGNDAVNYNVSFNYLNWTMNASNSAGTAITV